MFPTMGDLHVAPFSDELLYMEQFTKANFWYQQSFHGVDLSPLRDDAVSMCWNYWFAYVVVGAHYIIIKYFKIS